MSEEFKKNPKPPLGLTTRNFWLQQRAATCVTALHTLSNEEDWEKYKIKAKYFSTELLYAVTEWEKYYE